MASITKTQSGTWKAQVRRIGLPVVSKTFNTRHDAEVWSRSVESDQDRGVFVNRSEAVSLEELLGQDWKGAKESAEEVHYLLRLDRCQRNVG